MTKQKTLRKSCCHIGEARQRKLFSVALLLFCLDIVNFTTACGIQRDTSHPVSYSNAAGDGKIQSWNDTWEWDEEWTRNVMLHQAVYRCGDVHELMDWSCECCNATAVRDFQVLKVIVDTSKTLISIVGFSPILMTYLVSFRGKAIRICTLNSYKICINLD